MKDFNTLKEPNLRPEITILAAVLQLRITKYVGAVMSASTFNKLVRTAADATNSTDTETNCESNLTEKVINNGILQ